MNSLVEFLLNWLGGILVGSLLIEFGLSQWNVRSFSLKKYWAIVLITLGFRMILGRW